MVASLDAWKPFTDALASVLAILEEDQWLILEEKDGWGYIQLARARRKQHEPGTGATSNMYLFGTKTWSKEQLVQLRHRLKELGWVQPDTRDRFDDPDGYGSAGNSRRGRFQCHSRKSPRVAVETLVTVWELPYPGRDAVSVLHPKWRVEPHSDARPWHAVPSSQRAKPPHPEPGHILRWRAVKALRASMSDPNIDVDADGSIAVQIGNPAAVVYVHIDDDDDAPGIQVFAQVLVGVPSSPALMKRLDDSTTRTYTKWKYGDGILVVEFSWPTWPLELDHVHNTVDAVAYYAKSLGHKLQQGLQVASRTSCSGAQSVMRG